MAVTSDVSKSGDDTNKHIDIGSSFELNLSFGDTLYLHPNDTGGSPIVTIKLTGTENYKMWSIAMTFALRNHNKLSFIDGFCKKDNNNNPALANQWDIIILLCRKLEGAEKTVYTSLTFFSDTKLDVES
ncbi:ribonuclease H-like domain-containing protein [Tanacetum coccineum]